MLNKLCIVIPIYNHGKQLPKTIVRLLEHGLDIILVNDGSEQSTTDIIEQLCQKYEQIVYLENLSFNQGKGVAVTVGAKIAKRLGYTHFLQIDADGQHDSKDIPKFIAKMEQNPTALISGLPQYDETIPKSRLHGRKITNFWVAIETWMKIPESMCGFRVYPLESYLKLSSKRHFSKRMDFDIDALVRLFWSGVDILFIPTKVIYPEDGLSNFKMFRDNVRISWMHTKLVCGMIVRIPKLLARKFLK